MPHHNINPACLKEIISYQVHLNLMPSGSSEACWCDWLGETDLYNSCLKRGALGIDAKGQLEEFRNLDKTAFKKYMCIILRWKYKSHYKIKVLHIS